MIDRSMNQVVIPPGEEAMLAKVEAAVERERMERYGDQVDVPWRVFGKVVLARLIHPFGVHLFINWRQYDVASDRLMTMGLVCRFCPVGRVR